MEPDYIDHNGERISPDSIRARMSRERQAEVDARFAAYFSTSSEMGQYDIESVRELYKRAR